MSQHNNQPNPGVTPSAPLSEEKNDERVIVFPNIPEMLHHTTNMVIHIINHGRVNLHSGNLKCPMLEGKLIPARPARMRVEGFKILGNDPAALHVFYALGAYGLSLITKPLYIF